jgi:uncharacterized membrane protein YjjP (DUF1212 family)/uncharacterized membrane protein YjjB (DUF3815 family)
VPTDSARLHAIFDLAMRIAEGLLTNGAAASEVTATVLRVTSSSGLRNVSVQVTFSEVTISYLADEASTPFTRVRNANDRVQDFSRLAAFEDVTHQYITGELSLDEARRVASEIPQTKPAYRLSLVAGGFAVLGGAAALSLGAGTLVVLAATLAAAMMIVISDFLTRRSIPAFYSQALGGLVAVLVAVLVALIQPAANSSIVVVSCIIVQLAGLTSIGAVQDAVTGWYLTAAGRILETLMLTVGLVAGVRGGLLAADLIGAEIAVSAAMPISLASVVVLAVSGAAMGLGYAIGTYAPARLLLGVAIISGTSSALAHLLGELALDRVSAVAVATFLAGMASVFLGDRLRAPSLLFVMAGLIPLVPGGRIFRGLLGLGDDFMVGAEELFSAAEIAIAIAAGAVLGQLLASRILPRFRRRGIAYTPAISAPFTTLRRRRVTVGPRMFRRPGQVERIEPSTMTGEMTALSPAMFEEIIEDPPEQRSDPEEPR